MSKDLEGEGTDPPQWKKTAGGGSDRKTRNELPGKSSVGLRPHPVLFLERLRST